MGGRPGPVALWLDHRVSERESMSRVELIELARCQDVRIAERTETIARQDAQITALSTQLADLMDRFEEVSAKLARVEHLLSRNSDNSNFPSFKDGGIGGSPPSRKERRTAGRAKGKQKGAPGSALRLAEKADAYEERFPEGICPCGSDLADAEDLGVVDRYQQHEIPLVSVKVTEYGQHAVACSCGTVHTASRPDGAGAGQAEYGPQLKAFAAYLMVMHFVPVARCQQILASLTGTEPSLGFVHGLLKRTAELLAATDRAIRTLISLCFVLRCDETPLKAGSPIPAEGKKEAKRYLLVACTELYTHYLLGDRSLETFKQFVFPELGPDAVIVHDRYQNYDSTQLGVLNHQLCLAHVLRDLKTAAELYPEHLWPTQLAAKIRELIRRANTARTRGAKALTGDVLESPCAACARPYRWACATPPIWKTTGPEPASPGSCSKSSVSARPTSCASPAIYGSRRPRTRPNLPRSRRRSPDASPASTAPKDRYLVRGVLSTAVKHLTNPMAILRDVFRGKTWLPPAATALA